MMHASRWLMVILSLFTALCVVGCGTSSRNKKRDFTPAQARFYIEARDSDAAAGVRLPVSGVQIAVSAKPVLTEFDIVGVQEAQSELGKCLVFQFSGDATRDLYRLSTTNQGRRLVLTINGVPMGARMIERPIGNGAVVIFVETEEKNLPIMVKDIRGTTAEIQEELARKG